VWLQLLQAANFRWVFQVPPTVHLLPVLGSIAPSDSSWVLQWRLTEFFVCEFCAWIWCRFLDLD
jgi:hypothetical protein